MSERCPNCRKTDGLCIGFLGHLFCSDKCADEFVAKIPEIEAALKEEEKC